MKIVRFIIFGGWELLLIALYILKAVITLTILILWMLVIALLEAIHSHRERHDKAHR